MTTEAETKQKTNKTQLHLDGDDDYITGLITP